MSTTLDILINVVRVSAAREHVASVGSLVGDLFQTMLVYRDSSAEIFCKCCALLQLLAVSPTVSHNCHCIAGVCANLKAIFLFHRCAVSSPRPNQRRS